MQLSGFPGAGAFDHHPNSEGAGQIRSVGKGGPEVAAPAWSRPERSEW